MQATVYTFDDDTGAGSVAFDDGRRMDFSPEAFRAGRLRMLRPGQRVKVALDDDGAIVSLTILTLPDPD